MWLNLSVFLNCMALSNINNILFDSIADLKDLVKFIQPLMMTTTTTKVEYEQAS